MENIITTVLLVVILGLVTDIWRLSKSHRNRNKVRQVILDTSVIIDGRILDLAKTGFINDELIIPRSVLSELQLLADGSNPNKRTRARFGMDIIAKLQKVEQITVTILPDDRQTPEGVDNRLLELAKANDYTLSTIDYNLNKVAMVEGVKVLNINELAKVIRMQILPGEHLSLELVQEGQSKDQAVGYLPDGSMVVVANGKKQIGKTVEIEISRSLQTDAGKMIFAELVDSQENNYKDTALVSKTTEEVFAKNHKANIHSHKINNHKKSINKKNKTVKTSQTRSRKVNSRKKTQKSKQELYIDRIIRKTSSK